MLNRRILITFATAICLATLIISSVFVSAQNAGEGNKGESRVEGKSAETTDREAELSDQSEFPFVYSITNILGLDESASPVASGEQKPASLNRLPAGVDQGVESEPNNSFGTADVLTGTEGRIKASLFSGVTAPAATDPDWFAFTTTVAGSKIYAATINSSAAQQDTVLAVIASDGTTLLETDDQDGSFGGGSSSIAGTILATPGTYYLRVTNFSVTAPIAPYDLYFAVRSGATTVETEPNNDGTPQVLPASQYVNGAIDPVGDTDTFTFTANAGDTVFLSQDLDPERDVTNFNGRIGIGSFGTPAQFLVTSDAGTFDTIDSEAMVMTVDTTGTYTVYVDSQTAGQGGPTATYAFNVTTIPAAAAGTCTTYTNATSTPIADLALTSSTISIPDSKIIKSLRVTTDITHANFPDLDVHLRSPSNNDNGLFTDVGASTQTGPQNINLMDEAALPQIFTSNNGMIYKPEAAYRLNWFKGENALGTWTLDIRDDTTANAGTLNSWSLEVCEEPALTGTEVYSQTFDAGDGGYVGSGTANEWEFGTPATAAQTVTFPFIAPFLTCATGTTCWKTDLDNTYNISSSQDLTSPTIDLTTTTAPINLYWQARYQMESTSFDRIWARVTEVGNPTNTRLIWHGDQQTMGETNGSGASLGNLPMSAGWGRYGGDISDFAGRNITVTFHLESDSSVNYGGFAIDDVSIRGTIAATPVTQVVNSAADTSDGMCTTGAGGCTLRDAISVAGGDGLANNITFDIPADSAGCTGTNCTITVTSPLTPAADGGLLTTIDGSAGANRVTLSGGAQFNHILSINNGTNINVNDLNFTRGTSNFNGGAMAVAGGGTLTLTNSALYGNANNAPGGGLRCDTGCVVNLTNVTISGNESPNGGGISNEGTVTATNCTLTGNSGSFGSGGVQNSGTFNIRNTIIAGNSAFFANTSDVSGVFASQGNNLIGKTDGTNGFTQTGDQTGTVAAPLDARLAPLGNYGGKTLTHALLEGGAIPSPAINAVTATGAPLNDQRGAARVGQVDIGAFEVNNSSNSGSFRATLPDGFLNNSYSFTLVPSNGTTTYAVTGGNLPNGVSLTTSFAPSAVVALAGTPTNGGVFNFSVTASDGVNSGVTDYRLNIVVPTAAGVSVSGRVTTSDGRGLRNATVTMTDSAGVTKSARTGTFGYYRFDDVGAGQTYVIGVASKRYVFAPRTISVSEELTDLDFIAQ